MKGSSIRRCVPVDSEPESATAVDLFSGAGGLSLGMTNAGFRVLVAVDSWEPAVETYAANFTHPVLHKDIKKLKGRDIWDALGARQPVDVVVGGPPCQGFSVQRIGEDDDDRNDLVAEFGRLVEELNPRMFLMENVPGILGKRGKDQLQRFRIAMHHAGYTHRTWTLNAADYGVPQIRKRVFVVGWLTHAISGYVVPEPTHAPDSYVTVQSAIGDLPQPPSDYTPQPGDALHRRSRMSDMNKQRISLIPPGGGFEDLPEALRVTAHRAGAARIGHRYVYGRLHPDRPAGTITARFDSFTRGRFGHPTQNRSITLREGARLQTFPDDFQFVGTQEEVAALIGNAVPPLLASYVAHELRNALDDSEGGSLSPSAKEDQMSLFRAEVQHGDPSNRSS